MPKNFTITVDAEVDDGLHSVVGRRRNSRFLNDLASPHVVGQADASGYAGMTATEAGEAEAAAWDWFNNQRLLEPIGNIPAAEAEACYRSQFSERAVAA